MATITFTGYRPGVKPIGIIKVIREYTGLGLYDAKNLVDRFLPGERVSVEVPDPGIARVMAREVAALGAVVELTGVEETPD